MFADNRSTTTDKEFDDAVELMRGLGYSELRISRNAAMVACCIRGQQGFWGRSCSRQLNKIKRLEEKIKQLRKAGNKLRSLAPGQMERWSQKVLKEDRALIAKNVNDAIDAWDVARKKEDG